MHILILFEFQLAQGICDISFVTSPFEFFTELRDTSSPRTSRHETASPLTTPSTSQNFSGQHAATFAANGNHTAARCAAILLKSGFPLKLAVFQL